MAIWRQILVVVLVLLIASCTSSPAVRTTTDPSADFAAYHSFALGLPQGPNPAGYHESVTERLRFALLMQLPRLGFALNEQRPDVLVTYQLTTQPRPNRNGVSPIAAGRTWGPEYLSDVDDGFALSDIKISVIDAKSGLTVWSGSASTAIIGVASTKLDERTQAVVANILAKYPN